MNSALLEEFKTNAGKFTIRKCYTAVPAVYLSCISLIWLRDLC